MAMRVVLIIVATLLGGCANSTLVVKGNMPGTAWVAEKVSRAHSEHLCSEARAVKREVQLHKSNDGTWVYLRSDC